MALKVFVMFKVIKILFHLGTLFIPLILWWIIKGMFTTSYQDKLTKIQGIGTDTAKLIKEKYPTEEELRNASAEEIATKISGVGKGTAEKIKSKFT